MRTPALCAARTPSWCLVAASFARSMIVAGSCAALSMMPCSALKVGTSATSLSRMTRMVCASSIVQCSIESILHCAAIRIPSAPCACVVIFTPSLCASSTAARVSSRVYCDTCGPAPPPSTPPVENSLMTPAPERTCSRMPLRISSMPSQMRPTSMPWPPVVVIPRAAASKSFVPSKTRCAWQLIMPGTTKPTSMVRDREPFGVLGARERFPTQVISPSSTTIAAWLIVAVPSNMPSASRTVRIGPQYRPAMPDALVDRLRARGAMPPSYDGRGLLNVPATVLDAFGARTADDPPVLADLDRGLLDGVRQIVVILADGLGWWQLERFCTDGVTPFLARMCERAHRRADAQLLEATSVFPSTTAAAITTMHTARTPQEHGNIAYCVWLEEFAQVTAMLRWGPAVTRRGSYFDDGKLDPRTYVKAPSIHGRLRERGVVPYVVEPEMFRNEAMTRMHAREATYVGYVLPTTMGVRLRDLVAARPHGTAPSYVYAYWAGIDTSSHLYGPMSDEAAAEAASLDLNLSRALGDRDAGDTLVLLTADHGHAFTDPDKQIDLLSDNALRALLRNPIAGEPRLAFLHTDHPALVRQHLEERWPGTFDLLDREELISAGLFGRGDPAVARRRIGEVCAMVGADRSARIMRVDGLDFRHRGSHGGMSPEEMRIPILAWRA